MRLSPWQWLCPVVLLFVWFSARLGPALGADPPAEAVIATLEAQLQKADLPAEQRAVWTEYMRRLVSAFDEQILTDETGRALVVDSIASMFVQGTASRKLSAEQLRTTLEAFVSRAVPQIQKLKLADLPPDPPALRAQFDRDAEWIERVTLQILFERPLVVLDSRLHRDWEQKYGAPAEPLKPDDPFVRDGLLEPVRRETQRHRPAIDNLFLMSPKWKYVPLDEGRRKEYETWLRTRLGYGGPAAVLDEPMALKEAIPALLGGSPLPVLPTAAERVTAIHNAFNRLPGQLRLGAQPSSVKPFVIGGSVSEAVLTGREFLPKAAEIPLESRSDKDLARIDGLKRGEWPGQWRLAVDRWSDGLLFLVEGPDDLHNDLRNEFLSQFEAKVMRLPEFTGYGESDGNTWTPLERELLQILRSERQKLPLFLDLPRDKQDKSLDYEFRWFLKPDAPYGGDEVPESRRVRWENVDPAPTIRAVALLQKHVDELYRRTYSRQDVRDHQVSVRARGLFDTLAAHSKHNNHLVDPQSRYPLRSVIAWNDTTWKKLESTGILTEADPPAEKLGSLDKQQQAFHHLLRISLKKNPLFQNLDRRWNVTEFSQWGRNYNQRDLSAAELAAADAALKLFEQSLLKAVADAKAANTKADHAPAPATKQASSATSTSTRDVVPAAGPSIANAGKPQPVAPPILTSAEREQFAAVRRRNVLQQWGPLAAALLIALALGGLTIWRANRSRACK